MVTGIRRTILVLVAILAATAAHARTASVAEYVGALQRMHSLLASNQPSIAKVEAQGWRGASVGAFHADDSLLQAISNATGPDPALLTRIELTIAELNTAARNGPAPDAKLLQEVANEQQVPDLARGGEITTPVVPEIPLMERVARSFLDMIRWVGEKIGDFIRWLRDLFPHSRPGQPDATSGLRWIVITIVIAIVIAILVLAFEVMRRSRAGAPVATSAAPLRSARDDDPLSRGATEWEQYATQLAADGRFREAIRAWYHAVLVTSYAAGALHFRKGRTNWEYIASLPPSVAWRADLIALTQRFEQEWYGSLQSTREVLDQCAEHARTILAALRRVSRGAA